MGSWFTVVLYGFFVGFIWFLGFFCGFFWGSFYGFFWVFCGFSWVFCGVFVGFLLVFYEFLMLFMGFSRVSCWFCGICYELIGYPFLRSPHSDVSELLKQTAHNFLRFPIEGKKSVCIKKFASCFGNSHTS